MPGESDRAAAGLSRPIDHPSAWRAGAFRGPEDFSETLTSGEIAVLEASVRGFGDCDATTITPDDIDLSGIAGAIQDWRRTLFEGRGFLVLKGWPVERHPPEHIARMFWGLGLQFGRPVSQSLMGDRLGHVISVSGANPNERGYRSSRALDFHTDSDDVVGLLCLKQGRTGGVSKLASAAAVHNALLERHPDCLGPLMRGFRYHWRGEQPPDEPPITDYHVPVLSAEDGVLSACYLRGFIDRAYEDLPEGLSQTETDALDTFDALLESSEFKLEFTMEDGDLLLFNNYAILHGRSAYQDPQAVGDEGSDADRRHLLRLWLKADVDRPVNPAVRRFYGADGLTEQAGKGTVFDPEKGEVAAV